MGFRAAQNRRQVDPNERELLAALRGGDPRLYLAHAASSGRLVVADDRGEAKRVLLSDWWQHGSLAPSENVMIALRRDDVLDLNLAAHVLMTDAGRLGRERLAVGEIELASGDRVVCRENDRTLAVRNGTRGTILTVDGEACSLTLQTDAGRTVEIPPDYLERGRIELGYAITGHASQGITLDRAFVLAPASGARQEWGYVAFSRARLQTRIYAVERDLDPDDHLPTMPTGDGLERVARSLAEQAAKPLARDLVREAGVELEL